MIRLLQLGLVARCSPAPPPRWLPPLPAASFAEQPLPSAHPCQGSWRATYMAYHPRLQAL